MFITLEGIEGSGKSTVQKALAAHYTALGRTVLCTREPGGSELGKTLRALLLDIKANICSQAELFLFLADRAQHIEEVIRPALVRGEVVLCDRFIHSTIAYQGGGRGIPLEQLQNLNAQAIQGLLPHKVLLLDLSVEQGLTRARARNEVQQITQSEGRFDAESLAFHEQIRNSYLQQAADDRTRFCLIDASKSPQEVVEQCLKALSA